MTVGRRRASSLALALLMAALLGCGWFRLTGGRWERVESPSMGTTAPVGTLLWVRPVTPQALRAGDLVSFDQPGGGPVFSHRITRVYDDGSFTTAGDLSGPDRWRVRPGDLVGRVTWVWPAAGRLAQAAPLLLIGGLLTWALARRTRGEPRLALALVGASLTLAVAVVAYRPLVGAELLGTENGGAGPGSRYVSTGVLPVAIYATSDSSSPPVMLRPGQAGSVTAPADPDGTTRVVVRPAVPTWFWVLVIASAIAPSILGSLAGVTRPARPTHP